MPTRYQNNVVRALSDHSFLTLYYCGDSESFADGDIGGSDRLFGGTGAINLLYGDCIWMNGTACGGNDILIAGDASLNALFGDAYTMDGTSRGGNDRLISNVRSNQEQGTTLCGDASVLQGQARGGNDVLAGAAGVSAYLIGDGNQLHESAQGGDDVLRGASGAAFTMVGDAQTSFDACAGGNDRLYGGSGSNGYNTLCGDVYINNGQIHCGDDLIVAGNGAINMMYGDVLDDLAGSISGNDRLVAGSGRDTMRGDSGGESQGRDTFVFSANTGTQDVVVDFVPGLDQIEISRKTQLRSFNDLELEPDGQGNLILHLDGANMVTLQGITSLTADDFVFS